MATSRLISQRDYCSWLLRRASRALRKNCERSAECFSHAPLSAFSRPWNIPRYPLSMGEIIMEAEEIPTPRSPQQSDSEGSTSSLELGSGVASIALGGVQAPQEAVKCRWQHCGLWFKHLDQLAAHVTMVHAAAGQGGLFYCGWEGCLRGHRGFNARYKMLVHVRTHTNEKPHRCTKCDKSFSRAENLKIHARSHTGERPYMCPVPGCNKAYSNSSDRFKHTRTHAVDKPYVCKVEGCPKRYTDPSSLRKHVKTYRHFPGGVSPASPQASSPSPQASPAGSLAGSDEDSRGVSAFRPVISPASTDRPPLPGEYRGIPIKKSISARVRVHSELDSDCTDGSLSPPALHQRTWAGGSVWVSEEHGSQGDVARTSPETLSPSSSPNAADWFSQHAYSVPSVDVYRSWMDSPRLPWGLGLPLWHYPTATPRAPTPSPLSCASSASSLVPEEREQSMPLDLTVARH